MNYQKIFMNINGLRQGMFIQCENENNPVLLFLHGGPGSPEFCFSSKYPTGLEKLFTVCWWDQRGAGMSYGRKIPKEAMTVENMISDTVFVTNYLRERFNKDKIYIMGHSWGTALGVFTVRKYPRLFHAYIGMGQLVNQDQSERMAYRFMLNKYIEIGDKGMAKKFKRFDIEGCDTIPYNYLSLRSKGMLKLGCGTMHNCRSMGELISAVLAFKGYTLAEKLKYTQGNSFSLKIFWDYITKYDFFENDRTFEIPVYIFHGKFDYQVSYELSKLYFDVIEAPAKRFYTFENSAHSPCFEEPAKMIKIFENDILGK